MAYWIFKVTEQELYPDVLGEKYVYDNTHSVRVAEGDIFLYLDKRKDYSFTATGEIRKISERTPTIKEFRRTSRIRTVFTAHLQQVIWFKRPLTISPNIKEGRKNRSMLGLVDVNLLGWSQSIPSLSEMMYQKILDLADVQNLVPSSQVIGDFSIPDNWGKTRVRSVIKKFTESVMARSNSTCIVCGTSLPGVVEAAHLSPYASDKNNRANPGNGVCLCKFCHRAFDLRLIAIAPDGSLLVAPDVVDPIALHHFSQIEPKQRLFWLQDVNPVFLELTVQWFEESLSNKSLHPAPQHMRRDPLLNEW